MAVFDAATCATCPLAEMCVKTPGQGRTIGIHPYEHQLQAAAERPRQPDFPALMAQRPTVERKQAHWNRSLVGLLKLLATTAQSAQRRPRPSREHNVVPHDAPWTPRTAIKAFSTSS